MLACSVLAMLIVAQVPATTEIINGLKEALSKGTTAAVASLGKEDGYFGNEKVKIPLPPEIARAEKTLRMFGGGKQADELVLTMNRAAEAAVPEAKALFLDAIRKMTFDDAKGILNGGDNAATLYFRGKTESSLREKFQPVVTRMTEKVGLARAYNNVAGKASKFGLIKMEYANIEEYVTQKALDGLFLMVGEEEQAIRKDPASYGSTLLKKVFGFLR